MAILVQHLESQQVFVLIGTGYGAYRSTRPSLLGGSLFPYEDSGEIPVAAVSNEFGVIQWIYTQDLKVIEIDGVKIEEILAPFNNGADEEVSDFSLIVCPACQTKLSPEDTRCPLCGLVFPGGTDEDE